MANKRRTYRVAERIQALVATHLQRLADPRFHLITITSAMLSPDMKQVKVFWTIHGDEEKRQEAEKAFEGATGVFRRLVADELDIRFAPAVKFIYDNSLDEAERMDKIFDSIRQGEK